MIATDANVSRILIARQADSYLPGNIAAGSGWGGEVGGSRGWGCCRLEDREKVVTNSSFPELLPQWATHS